MGRAREPVLVETLVAGPAVERFDVGVLVRPARLDQTQRDAARRRCCMKTICGWGGVVRTSRDHPQEPHYRDAVEGPSQV